MLAANEDIDAICISAVTLWEAHLLLEKGRIESRFSPISTIKVWLSAYPIQTIPIDQEIALLSRTLDFHHEDPADRFIAATAFRMSLPLATVDEKLMSLPWLTTIQ